MNVVEDEHRLVGAVGEALLEVAQRGLVAVVAIEEGEIDRRTQRGQGRGKGVVEVAFHHFNVV